MSVEHNAAWHQKINEILPSNCQLFLEEDAQNYVNNIENTQSKYDIIIIDGEHRYKCAKKCIDYLNPDGIIIFDNTEWHPNSTQFLRDAGFVQIDFAGFPPLNAFRSVTSLFFTSPKLLEARTARDITPKGGHHQQSSSDYP